MPQCQRLAYSTSVCQPTYLTSALAPYAQPNADAHRAAAGVRPQRCTFLGSHFERPEHPGRIKLRSTRLFSAHLFSAKVPVLSASGMTTAPKR